MGNIQTQLLRVNAALNSNTSDLLIHQLYIYRISISGMNGFSGDTTKINFRKLICISGRVLLLLYVFITKGSLCTKLIQSEGANTPITAVSLQHFQSGIKVSFLDRLMNVFPPFVSHGLLLSKFRGNRRYMTDWRQKHQHLCVGGKGG